MPPHAASAQDVEVQVRDGLPGVPAGVGDQAPSVLEPVLLREPLGGQEDSGQDGCVLGRGVGKRRNGLDGDDQRVERCLGIDILDGEDEFFAQEEFRRDRSLVDLLEKSGFGHGSKDTENRWRGASATEGQFGPYYKLGAPRFLLGWPPGGRFGAWIFHLPSPTTTSGGTWLIGSPPSRSAIQTSARAKFRDPWVCRAPAATSPMCSEGSA